MIVDNVLKVIDNINNTALRSGRDPSDITIVAVTKTRTVDEIEEALEAGIEHLGENRLQEAQSKIPVIKSSAVWHMVGHLQSNKAKNAVEFFHWIDSVDSKKIVKLLSAKAVEIGKILKVLVQVNISGESYKSGVDTTEANDLVTFASTQKGLVVQGLMTIGSFGVRPDVTRTEFARMRALFDTINSDTNIANSMKVLSMGMSGDYRIAIEEGATMVRIGTAIFGERN